MSIAHVFSSIVTHKKNENKKNFRHIEIMIFTTFFVNQFFRTRYKKKSIHAITHKEIIITHKKSRKKSRIIEMFIKYENETNKQNQTKSTFLV